MQESSKTLVTIVIPVYNMEKYLSKCIESVINQSYDNIEIIVINDGSTDSSGDIIKQYAINDNRIKVITTDNNGLSAARNRGITQGHGEYIAFIDSDDYVSKDYIKVLLETCKEYNASISQCYYYNIDYRCFEDVFEDVDIETEVKVYGGREMVLNLYNHMMLPSTFTWTKLYKKDLFNVGEDTLDVLDENNIAFPQGRIYEDDYVSYRLFHKAMKIAVVNKKLYAYRKTPGSITNGVFTEKGLDLMLSLEARMRYYRVHNDLDILNLTYRRYYYELCRTIYKTKMSKDNILEWKKIIKELNNKKKKTLLLILGVRRFEDKSFVKTQLIKLKCIYKFFINNG